MTLFEIRNVLALAISTIEIDEVEKGLEDLDEVLKYLDGRFSVAEMKNIVWDTPEEDSQRFRDFLKRNREEVMKWPEWKRNLLGRIPQAR